MEQREIGPNRLAVSAIGFGCVAMSDFYERSEDQESLATLRRAVELGVTLFDTSDAYGVDGHNERILGRAVAPFRDEVVLASKFGIVKTPDGTRHFDGSPRRVVEACEASLQRLGTDRVDLYYAHRVDPNVPIEDTVGAMAQLVAEGKVRHLGLCEASADSLRRASSVHPITALQSEWSLWCRDLESEVVPTARSLGIGIIPFSPLGRGLLAGALTESSTFEPGDFRRNNPRFQGENLRQNVREVAVIQELARDEGVSIAQLALAWLLFQGSDVVPIPGTRRANHLAENLDSAAVALSPDTIDRLNAANAWAGERYRPEVGTPFGTGYGDSPPRRAPSAR